MIGRLDSASIHDLRENDDLYGEGVNVAARLERLGEPGQIYVSGVVRDNVRHKVRARFEDFGPTLLKNMGTPVQVLRLVPLDREEPTDPPASRSRPRGRTTEKPSIAVFPFQTVGPTAGNEYLGIAIPDEIITRLASVRNIAVISRASSFTLAAAQASMEDAARQRNVRFILDGSVRSGGDRVHVSVRLSDMGSRQVTWAKTFDGALSTVFDLQDDIAVSVAGELDPVITTHFAVEARRHPTSSLSAWGLVAQAYGHLSQWTKEGHFAAQPLLDQAIGLDDKYAKAFALLGFSHSHCGYHQYIADRSEAYRQGEHLARRALELDAHEPWAHYAMSSVLIGRPDLDGALAEAQLSVKLSPSFSAGHRIVGVIHAYRGESHQARPALDLALRLGPNEPSNETIGVTYAMTHFIDRDYPAAIRSARDAIRARPNFPGGWLLLASALALAGQEEEARAALRRLKELRPLFTIDAMRLSGFCLSLQEHVIEGLVAAGLSP